MLVGHIIHTGAIAIGHIIHTGAIAIGHIIHTGAIAIGHIIHTGAIFPYNYYSCSIKTVTGPGMFQIGECCGSRIKRSGFMTVYVFFLSNLWILIIFIYHLTYLLLRAYLFLHE